MQPIADAFERLWPAAERMNLLEDRLSADLAAAGALDDALTQRFVFLAQYAQRAGADGILFTCSAFGPAIEAAARAVDVPAYKPNEAMFLDALAAGGAATALSVGLLATFAPSLPSMAEELTAMARERGASVALATACADGAMEALAAGDAQAHDRLVCESAQALAQCDVILLAQFSMARARRAVAERTGKPVFASPDSAVLRLQQALRRPSP